MTFKTLDDADLAGQRALARVDLNVPMADGKVTDDTRLRAVVTTIKKLQAGGAKVVLLAHFDRPKGKRVPEMSLKPVVPALSKVLGAPVAFADDCVGEAAAKAVAALKDGEVLLLENVRYHAGEEKNDPEFARELAANGDLYVNDAFSAAHRAHASTEGLARLLPAYAGEQMRKELEALDAALGNPKRPVLGIVGGAKVSTKLDLLNNLVGKLDYLAIGGGMANTFRFAQGYDVGASLCEKDMANTARPAVGSSCPSMRWWPKSSKPARRRGSSSWPQTPEALAPRTRSSTSAPGPCSRSSRPCPRPRPSSGTARSGSSRCNPSTARPLKPRSSRPSSLVRARWWLSRAGVILWPH
jgi:phosphoglycerate kinase